MPPQLESDVLAHLAATEEIVLETRRRDGRGRRTPVWVVVVNGQAYVRSWHGARGAWYRDLLRDPTAGLHAGDRTVTVKAAPVDDARIIEQVSQAYRQKYDFSAYARRYAGEMVLPETLPTTTRLELASPV